MAYFLNLGNEKFCKDLNANIFVDKTMLISQTNKLINTNRCFMCVTRPRRFGKLWLYQC